MSNWRGRFVWKRRVELKRIECRFVWETTVEEVKCVWRGRSLELMEGKTRSRGKM